MWLALLAAVLDDAAVETPRRAASHELARRLGIGWRREAAAPSALTLREVVLRLIEQAGTVEDAVALAMASNHLVRVFTAERITYPYVDFGPYGADWPTQTTHPSVPFVEATSELTPFFPWFVRVYRHEVDLWFSLWPDPMARTRNYTTFVASMLHPMDQVLDWARAHPLREVLATPPERAREVAEGWHRTMAMTRDSGAPRLGVVVARFADGATIQRLFTRAQLDAEGKSMGHCVGTHHTSVTDGHSEVFSYRDARGLPQATWEVTARYGPFGLGVDLLDLEGPENEKVATYDARRRVAAWLGSAGIALRDFAQKVGREGAVVDAKLVPSGLFAEDAPPERWTEEMRAIDAKLQEPRQGYISVARARDTAVMETVREKQSAEALSWLTLLANALDLGTMAYLNVPRLVSRDEEPVPPLSEAILAFDYGSGLDESMEAQIGRTRQGEPMVVIVVRDVEEDTLRRIGAGRSVLTALRQAHLLETIVERAARIDREQAQLVATGLVAALPPAVAHSEDRAAVEAASAALSGRG